MSECLRITRQMLPLGNEGGIDALDKIAPGTARVYREGGIAAAFDHVAMYRMEQETLAYIRDGGNARAAERERELARRARAAMGLVDE